MDEISEIKANGTSRLNVRPSLVQPPSEHLTRSAENFFKSDVQAPLSEK